MPFIYNPITNQLDITSSTGPGSGAIFTINNISPDSLGNFTLSAGANISLTPGVNGLTIASTGGGGGVTSITGTANQIIVSPTTGNAIASLAPSPIVSGTYTSTAGNLALPATNSSLTQGVIVIGGQNTLHAYSPVSGQENLFVGYLSGNGTNTGAQNYGFGKYTLNVLTNGSENVAIGPACMKFGAVSGIGNVGIGSHSGSVISSGSYNTFIGFQTAPLFDSGSYNVILGQNSASSYINTESSNILLSSAGVVADTHTIRIGTQGSGNGQQNLAFMAGINGVTVSNAVPVLIDSTTGQLGVGSVITQGIVTINGDSGSITGATVSIFANQVSNVTGSSVSFTNSGTTSTFSLIDPNNNMFLGFNAGNATNSGTSNVIIGPNAGFTLSTGNANIGLGDSSFSFLDTGTGNIGIGRQAGFQYTSSESYNILIGNPGTSGESNVIRIGDQGSGSFQQNQAFIAGIASVSVSNALSVVIDSTTGQLGTLANSPITSVASQTFTSSGTYTPTTGMVFCQIICVSGGGGGGGADSTGAVDSVGSGGGAGGVAIGVFTAAAIGGTPVVTIGAGGAGGVGIAGSNGGASLVTGVITINGGTGGNFSIAQDVVGGGGGTPIGGGDVQITGGDGGMGMYIGPATIYGGTGGLNGYGYPSTAVSAGSTAFSGGPGNPGNGYGSGGGGAVAVTANPGKQNGGAGASGIIYITEYISA